MNPPANNKACPPYCASHNNTISDENIVTKRSWEILRDELTLASSGTCTNRNDEFVPQQQLEHSIQSLDVDDDDGDWSHEENSDKDDDKCHENNPKQNHKSFHTVTSSEQAVWKLRFRFMVSRTRSLLLSDNGIFILINRTQHNLFSPYINIR
jgi:hypothetical protein